MAIALSSMPVPVVQGCYFNKQPRRPSHAVCKERERERERERVGERERETEEGNGMSKSVCKGRERWDE